MRRLLGSALAALLLASCTFISGVESLEVIRDRDASASPDGGPPSGRDAGSDAATLPSGTCVAEGSWIDCVPDTAGTCAAECDRRNLTCVDSCCAYDGKGGAAKVGGLWPAETATTCTGRSVEAYSGGGLRCGDSVPASGALVRCCCR